MKKYRQSLIRICQKNKLLLDSLILFSFLIKNENHKNRLKKIKLENKLYKLLDCRRTILSGPFKSMEYVSFEALCSELPPKLLGCYEHELEPVINKILRSPYEKIIDIGCAEGYYAVGFAKFGSMKKVEAYDIDPYALSLCAKMANENNVGLKLEIKNEAITAQKLSSFNFVNINLILCDCEGFEIQLFTQDSVKNLTRCDVLIEIHHTINKQIPSFIKQSFSHTHDIEIIKSSKVDPKLFPILDSFSKFEKELLLSEGRDSLVYDTIFEWYFFTPKNI